MQFKMTNTKLLNKVPAENISTNLLASDLLSSMAVDAALLQFFRPVRQLCDVEQPHKVTVVCAGPDGLTAVCVCVCVCVCDNKLQPSGVWRYVAGPILDIPDSTSEHSAFILKVHLLRNNENHPHSEEASVGL
jgi:hypothetical protein